LLLQLFAGKKIFEIKPAKQTTTMPKVFCFIAIFILVFNVEVYCNNPPEDSTLKKSTTHRKVNSLSLKQSIVRIAREEFEWWRSDTTLRETDDDAIRKLKQYWLSVGKQPEAPN
jgi:hypothetical protein